MHSDCDVLIVGAGPAGTVAALQLARAGARVRILDRAVFPRHKMCGDTLNPGCLSLLSRLDCPVADRIQARGLKTTGMTITGPGNVTVRADYPPGISGSALLRSELDQFLLEEAVRAGARFDHGVSVQSPIVSGNTPRVVGLRGRSGTGELSFRSPVVIAADGRTSRLAAALGLSRFNRSTQRWAYGAYYVDVAGLTTHGEMHVRADGYLGLAPLPAGLANICVVRGRRQLVVGERPHEVISRSISGDVALADRFARARRVSEVTVLGPLAVDAIAAGCRGLLLAGDAAGFVDPMTGDGLRFAIRGGQLAAQAALGELESGEAAYAALQAWRRREFSSKWRVNRALRALVGSPRALSCAAIASRAWQTPVERLVGIAGDVDLVGSA